MAVSRAWYARLCVKLQDMDRKRVSGDRFCVPEEQSYFNLNVNRSIKYLHGRDQCLMGQDADQKENVPFGGVGKRIFHSLLTSAFIRYFSHKYHEILVIF